MKGPVEYLQRLERVYFRLLEVLENYSPDKLDIVLDATVQRFEFTFELSWKAIKKFAEFVGLEGCNSPRSCLKLAYRLGWISDQKRWLNLLEARNLTSHTYDMATAWRVYELVKENHPVFGELIENLKGVLKEETFGG